MIIDFVHGGFSSDRHSLVGLQGVYQVFGMCLCPFFLGTVVSFKHHLFNRGEQKNDGNLPVFVMLIQGTTSNFYILKSDVHGLNLDLKLMVT